jgi:hypothetical protein
MMVLRLFFIVFGFVWAMDLSAQQSNNDYVINQNVKWLKNILESNASDIYADAFRCKFFDTFKVCDARPKQLFYYNIQTNVITITQKIVNEKVNLTDHEDFDKSYIFYPVKDKIYLNPEINIRINNYESTVSFDVKDIDTASIKITNKREIEIGFLAGRGPKTNRQTVDCQIYVVPKDTISMAEYDFMSYRLASEFMELTDDDIKTCNLGLKYSGNSSSDKVKILIYNKDNNRKLVIKALKNLYKLILSGK